jgi:molybdopterin-guanine dinucleotide biosynthesis protein A
MSRTSPTVGIVVAGGSGTRLGGADKAGLMLDGRTFLDRVIGAIEGSVDEIVVVAAEGQDLPLDAAAWSVPVRLIRDSAACQGPLAALADGLRAAAPSHPEAAVVVSCDVPKLTSAVVRLLAEAVTDADDECDWVVPHVGGHPQVLVSAMRMTMLPAIETHLASGRRDVRGLLEKVRTRRLDEPRLRQADSSLESFRDVDTHDDLRRLS